MMQEYRIRIWLSELERDKAIYTDILADTRIRLSRRSIYEHALNTTNIQIATLKKVLGEV